MQVTDEEKKGNGWRSKVGREGLWGSRKTPRRQGTWQLPTTKQLALGLN